MMAKAGKTGLWLRSFGADQDCLPLSRTILHWFPSPMCNGDKNKAVIAPNPLALAWLSSDNLLDQIFCRVASSCVCPVSWSLLGSQMFPELNLNTDDLQGSTSPTVLKWSQTVRNTSAALFRWWRRLHSSVWSVEPWYRGSRPQTCLPRCQSWCFSPLL